MTVDTNDPAFVKWFGASAVAVAGIPLPVVHGTRKSKNVRALNPYTHFGTMEAALKRCADKGIPENDRELVQVYLSISKPIDVIDDEADNNVTLLLNLPVSQGLVTKSEQATILGAYSSRSEEWGLLPPDEFLANKWRIGMEEVVRVLGPKGYDGLRYQNTQEGDTSYVPFTTAQVWWLDRQVPEL